MKGHIYLDHLVSTPFFLCSAYQPLHSKDVARYAGCWTGANSEVHWGQRVACRGIVEIQ
jgi:hypothetical protein